MELWVKPSGRRLAQPRADQRIGGLVRRAQIRLLETWAPKTPGRAAVLASMDGMLDGWRRCAQDEQTGRWRMAYGPRDWPVPLALTVLGARISCLWSTLTETAE